MPPQAAELSLVLVCNPGMDFDHVVDGEGTALLLSVPDNEVHRFTRRVGRGPVRRRAAVRCPPTLSSSDQAAADILRPSAA